MKFLIYIFCLDAGLGMMLSSLVVYANFTMIDMLIAAYAIVALTLRKNKIKKENQIINISILLSIFGFWQLTSLFMAQGNMVSGLGPVIRTFYYSFIVMFLTQKIDDKDTYNRMCISFVVGVFLNFLITLYLWNLDKRYFSGVILLNNSFINRNTIYYYAVFSLPFLFHLQNVVKSKLQLLTVWMCTVFFTTIGFFTMSKGAWLIIIVLYAWNFMNFGKKIKFIRFIISVALVAILFAIVLHSGVYTNFKSLQLSDYSVEDDIRITYKIEAIKTGLENIVFGVGPHNYREYSSRNNRLPTGDPHDVTLMIFAEYGLIGAMLYLIIIAICLKNILRKYVSTCLLDQWSYKKLVKTTFATYWILSLLTGFVFTSKLFVVMLFVILGYSKINTNCDVRVE